MKAQAVFICDDDCLVLAQWGCAPELAAAATWLAATWNSAGPRVCPSGDGTVAVQLDNNAWLMLLSGRSVWGRVYLGVCIDQLAEPLTIRAMQDALSSALKEK
ncbi:MAG: hypothetical protein GXP47_13185 [Acidobacteria bacterium]|nr:hypothetical protein [Acidobacteriota bacterium]